MLGGGGNWVFGDQTCKLPAATRIARSVEEHPLLFKNTGLMVTLLSSTLRGTIDKSKVKKIKYKSRI